MRRSALLAALGAFAIGCSDSSGPNHDIGPLRYDVFYEGYAGGIPEMFRLDTASGVSARILPAGTVAMDPTPSPDGVRVAYVVANYVDGTGDIFAVNLDGRNPVQLTNDPELDDSPSWSPDGTRIAFRSYRSGYDGEIWVMNADGTGLVNLTPNDQLPAFWDNRRPEWSPDGRSIAFASTRGGDWGIWVMNADGTGKRQLTNTPALDAEPSWSPNGLSIAFRRSDQTGSDIMVIPAAGGEAVRLPLAGEQRLPAWSPGGNLIAFVSQATASAQPELYVMRFDGQQVRRLSTSADFRGGIHPAWWWRR